MDFFKLVILRRNIETDVGNTGDEPQRDLIRLCRYM